MSADDDGPIGRGRPPKSSRWLKGTSGNPKGGRKKRNRDAPYETILGHMVEVDDAGVKKKMSAADAFLLHLVRRGMKRGGAIARFAQAAITAFRERHQTNNEEVVIIIEGGIPLGALNKELVHHGMAKKFDPYERTAHMLLQPWLVSAALDRLEDRRLSAEEQREVWGATLNPRKVKWPEWWTERRCTGWMRPPALSLADDDD